MNSLCSSNKPAISISNLEIFYNIDLHRPCTFRDSFISFISNPLKSLAGPQDRLIVLSEVNLKVYPGERLGLLGVNGSGKSSLCRAISGSYWPQKGEVNTKGKILALYDTTVGIIPELTGRENAQLLIEFLFSESTDVEKEKMLKDALDFSELGDFVDAPFQSYSKGMQARLCLSVVSSKGSDILILDEVFDGADQFFKEKISHRVLEMIKNSGSVIFVSHIASQIETVCDRVVILKDGRVAFDGDVSEGLRKYNEWHVN